MGSRNLKGEVA